MNLRRRQSKDSLDLLLDTMCNAFGGVILLAVLVALLARGTREQEGGADGVAQQILDRRVTRAETQLESLKQALATGADELASNRNVVDLLSERETRREQLESLRQDAARLAASLRREEATDANGRLDQLNSEMFQAQATVLNESNRLSSVSNEVGRAALDLNKARTRLASLRANAIQRLRLPREYGTSKDVYNIIVRHGELYPMQTPELALNRAIFDWKEYARYIAVTPLRGKGLDPRREKTKLDALLQKLRAKGVYIAFYVFEDSFDAFTAGKLRTMAMGLEYGWDPNLLSEEPLKFAAGGSSPSAQ
jgi:hypothetical protein